MKAVLKHTKLFMFLIDILIITVSAVIANILLTKKDFLFTYSNLYIIFNSIIISIIIYEIYLNIFKVYRNITRFENGKDYLIYILICALAGFTLVAIRFILRAEINSCRKQMLQAVITAVGLVGLRVIVRFVMNALIQEQEKSDGRKYNILIIGAGYAGRDIIRNIKQTMNEKYNVVGIIDDSKAKLHCLINGVEVLGNRKNIVDICKEKEVDEIFFAISKIDKKKKKEILAICQETGKKIRILPTTEDIIRNKNLFQNLREVDIEDILGRDPVKLDNNKIGNLIENKTILVTGAGGSIGSELCRQIVKYNPSKLVMLDIYENNLYNIELELKSGYAHIDIEAVIGSVRDVKRLEKVFEEYKPYLVFHAAAHKHVPLMEDSPLEAIKNNVFGTFNVANCADKYGSRKMILISTDKAVNPTNIMGATKRLCEMIIQVKNKNSKTEYAAVRFGNVLGSNGSVVPLFKKQIAAGGPVTVTHKDIIRYFMTIPEAAQLVLQAMSYAKGGEIFVLDMGEPVKIYDLAVSLIKLSGLEPNVDIPIVFTGLRPGEKLYEELLMKEEGLQKTENKKIYIGELTDLDEKDILEKLAKLKHLVDDEGTPINEIKETIHDVVPTYILKQEEKQEKKEKNTYINHVTTEFTKVHQFKGKLQNEI